MISSRWQKQHLHYRTIVWGVSAAASTLLILLLMALGIGVEVAGISFLVVFLVTRVALAFILKDRFANSMVRVLKFDYEEIERDFRMVFKNKNIRFYRRMEEDIYQYEFPGRHLNMTVQPYWVANDINQKPVTKVTLLTLNEKNKEFAEMLADSIDEMAEQRVSE